MKLKGGVTNRLQNAEQELPQVIRIATETADNEFLFFPLHVRLAFSSYPRYNIYHGAVCEHVN
jgi:hypothetical protein